MGDLFPRLFNSAGLIFDILGAWIIFRYVFYPRPKLIEQMQLPSKKEEKMIDGKKQVVISGGVVLSLPNIEVNRYNDYKEELYKRRGHFGFFCLALGFVFQLVSNFISVSDDMALKHLLLIFPALWILVEIWHRFIYLFDMEPLPDNAGRIFHHGSESTDGGLANEFDSVFGSWSKRLQEGRKRIGVN